MAVVTKTRTYSTGGQLTASNYNDDRDEIISGVNSIVNAQVAAGAGIEASKIANTAATLTDIQTLTNKTLTSPIITGSAGAAPTTAGQIQYDSTANRLKYGTGSTTISLGDSVMTDSGDYVKPTTDGDEVRAFHTTGGSDYIEIQHNGSDARVNAGAGHIVLTPASNKLVKIAVLERNDTTNTYKSNAVILTGITGSLGTLAANGNTQATIGFGVTFADVPIIVITASGSTGAPAQGAYVSSIVDTKTTTSAVVRVGNNGSSTSGTLYVDWIAIGVVS